MKQTNWRITTICFTLLFALAAASTAAQDSPESENEWKTISNSKEEISFEIPAEGFQDSSHAYRGDFFGFYSAGKNGTRYIVKSSPYLSSSAFEEALKLAAMFNNECSVSDFGIYRSYGCTFKESDFHTHSFRYIRTFERIYVLYSVTPAAPSAETDRFLNSAVFVRDLSPRNEAIAAKEMESVWERFQSGEYNRETPGIPNAVKRSVKPILKPDGPEKTPLRILTKPRPGYTELARVFGITGTVKLRVAFQADGTIGSIAVLESLPFGLTQKSIDAAALIRFEPEVAKNRAFTLKKTIVYRYSIY